MSVAHRMSLISLATALCVATVAPAEGEAGNALRRTPIVEAVQRVRDSVVNISTENVVSVRRGLGAFGPGDPFEQMFEDFWSGPATERRRVKAPLGSGCVITPDGLVITNEHVIRRATTIYLTLDTGERFEAELLGADPAEDLALLRAKADRPLKAIPMGGSSDLMLGETVIALGNPFGFENSVTSGIISALDRDISVGGGENAGYTGLVQISALINPGNSGGPLVNILGEMIGINVAVVDQAQGIGFAIPVNRARDVLAPLLVGPHVSEAWIGLNTQTIEGRRGARVVSLEKDSPAAGIEPGDVIQAIDDAPIRDAFELNLVMTQRKVGENVSLRLDRSGVPVTVKVPVARMPEPSPADLLRDKLGISGQEMTEDMARSLGAGVDFGVLISDVRRDGPASQAGLIRGDVIIQLGRKPVRNLRDAATALRLTRPGESLAIMIVRQNYRAVGSVTVPR